MDERLSKFIYEKKSVVLLLGREGDTEAPGQREGIKVSAMAQSSQEVRVGKSCCGLGRCKGSKSLNCRRPGSFAEKSGDGNRRGVVKPSEHG